MEYNRNKQRREWWQAHHEKLGLVPHYSMKRRKPSHDYSSPCIYMITIDTLERRRVLGELNAPGDTRPEPWLLPSELGHKVLSCWHEISSRYPQVKTMGVQLMPDHLHGILYATEKLPYHIGRVISGFKAGCNKASRQLIGGTLWEDGYQDTILRGKGQLKRMMHYLQDNPRRLWIKRQNPELFSIKNDITIGNRNVSVAGNVFLLEYPEKAVVQCSRSIDTEEAIAHEVEKYMSMAKSGVVLISAAISKAEKAVMRAAFEGGFKTIVILENGFSQYWKPGGQQFDACAQGRLLLVAPWPHHNSYVRITREQCLEMNAVARQIAEMP